MFLRRETRKNITLLYPIVLIILGLMFIIQGEQVRASTSVPVYVTAGTCVSSGTNSPVANVAVILKKAGTTINQCSTNSGGTCTTNAPNNDTYDVVITAPSGYSVITSVTGACPAALTTLNISSTETSKNFDVYLTSSTGGTTGGTYGLTNKPLKDIINGITEWLLGIAAGLTILYLVWGGIYYVTASGDENQVEDAKRIIKYALIGLFVIGISYSVVVALDKLIK